MPGTGAGGLEMRSIVPQRRGKGGGPWQWRFWKVSSVVCVFSVQRKHSYGQGMAWSSHHTPIDLVTRKFENKSLKATDEMKTNIWCRLSGRD